MFSRKLSGEIFNKVLPKELILGKKVLSNKSSIAEVLEKVK